MAWTDVFICGPVPAVPGACTRSGSGSIDRCGEMVFPALISRSIRCPAVSPSDVAAAGGDAPEPYPLVTEVPSATTASGVSRSRRTRRSTR